jgi:hypothetical protein
MCPTWEFYGNLNEKYSTERKEKIVWVKPSHFLPRENVTAPGKALSEEATAKKVYFLFWSNSRR